MGVIDPYSLSRRLAYLSGAGKGGPSGPVVVAELDRYARGLPDRPEHWEGRTRAAVVAAFAAWYWPRAMAAVVAERDEARAKLAASETGEDVVELERLVEAAEERASALEAERDEAHEDLDYANKLLGPCDALAQAAFYRRIGNVAEAAYWTEEALCLAGS